MKPHTSVRVLFTITLLLISVQSAQAGGHDPISIGFRAGWSGGPNGLTIRKIVGSNSAFEFVAGYNIKEGRQTNLPFYKQGNTLIGVAWQPFFISSEGNTGVGFFANIGARARFHNYRRPENKSTVMLTPDFFTGLGMQIEFSEVVEIFADLNAKYYNKLNNAYVWGLESGLGIRFRI